MLVSTVESDDLAFFAKFAEAVPEATITAETDESITPPRPVETALSETDELVDLCDERVQGVPAVVDRSGACRYPRSATSFRTRRAGSVPRRNWHGPSERSPRCCPRGATSGPSLSGGAGPSSTATDLADAGRADCGLLSEPEP